MKIRLISNCPHEIKKSFDCGNEVINDYFKHKANSDDDATTFCFFDGNEEENLIALSSLSCSGIIIESANKLSIYPAVEIKMFAVDKNYQHKKVSPEIDLNWSGYCLDTTIQKIYEFTESYCGAGRVILYSVSEAVNFYKARGFQPFTEIMRASDKSFLEGCTPMYMLL